MTTIKEYNAMMEEYLKLFKDLHFDNNKKASKLSVKIERIRCEVTPELIRVIELAESALDCLLDFEHPDFESHYNALSEIRKLKGE